MPRIIEVDRAPDGAGPRDRVGRWNCRWPRARRVACALGACAVALVGIASCASGAQDAGGASPPIAASHRHSTSADVRNAVVPKVDVPDVDDAPEADVPKAVGPDAVDGGAPRPVTQLPGWQADDLARLHGALARQCELARPPQPWPSLCRRLPEEPALKSWIATHFDAWPLGPGNDAPGLLTGYYEPLLTGSRTRQNDRQAPLYRRPLDMVAGPNGTRLRLAAGQPPVAYPPRAAIETDPVLSGSELVWVDDAVEAFFLQIQGSGRVRLRDGGEMRVGFADHNGQPYRAIGRELIDRGALAPREVDAQSIRQWLHANPGEARAVMHSNRRYVFFRELPSSGSDSREGPPGALGIALTPMRSVATDPGHVPAGALLFIDSTRPDDGSPLQRVVVSQDRGAAITGAVRADLFWGTGDEPGRLAGITRQKARIWLLWPRGSKPPGR